MLSRSEMISKQLKLILKCIFGTDNQLSTGSCGGARLCQTIKICLPQGECMLDRQAFDFFFFSLHILK